MVSLRQLEASACYSAVALVLGVSLYLGLGLLPWTSWVVQRPHIAMTGTPVEHALSFALTSLLCAWLLKRWIRGAATGGDVVTVCILGLVVGGGLFWWIHVATHGVLQGEFPVELREGDWIGFLVGSLIMPGFGIAIMLSSLPVTFPLAWLGVRLLHGITKGRGLPQRAFGSA